MRDRWCHRSRSITPAPSRCEKGQGSRSVSCLKKPPLVSPASLDERGESRHLDTHSGIRMRRLPVAPLALAKYRLVIRPRESILLPEYKGSAFRGGFGHALRRVVCPFDDGRCYRGCIQPARCVYSYVFETPLPEEIATIFAPIRRWMRRIPSSSNLPKRKSSTTALTTALLSILL